MAQDWIKASLKEIKAQMPPKVQMSPQVQKSPQVQMSPMRAFSPFLQPQNPIANWIGIDYYEKRGRVGEFLYLPPIYHHHLLRKSDQLIIGRMKTNC